MQKLLVQSCAALSLATSAFGSAWAQGYPLPDTGQTVCYAVGEDISCPEPGQKFFGQDAQIYGLPSAYTIQQNGTVQDTVTQLIWQRDPQDEKMSWQDAQQYCSQLDLGDCSDWRTPSLKELFSISDFSSGWPYINTDVFELNGSEKDQQYWSNNFYEVGTTHNGAPSAFGVNHVTGHIKAYPAEAPASENMQPPQEPDTQRTGAPSAPDTSDTSGTPGALPPEFGKYVRCVAGETYGENAFVDNGDGTVTDSATGLMWSQASAAAVMDWEEALAYAERMNAEGYLGHSDWRLPNIRELQSIVDYSGAFPAIDGDLFEATADYYWSSTSAYFSTSEPEYFFAWYVAFGYAPGPDGEDIHGAGAVRFASKSAQAPEAEGDARYSAAVRLVRSE